MSRQQRTGICLIGNGLNALGLAYCLEKQKIIKNGFLFLQQHYDDLIKSIFYNSNIIENGFIYSFNRNQNSVFFGQLLKELNLEENILEINKYSNNISYVDEKGNKYKIGKYIFRILFSLCKDYCINSHLRIDKDDNLYSYLLKCFDRKICENIIIPYCYHYFCCSPFNISLNSYFPQLKEKVQDKRSLIRYFFLSDKKGSFFSKNNKVFTLKGGNVSLTNKLMNNVNMSSNINVVNSTKSLMIKSEGNKVKIFSGRKKIKHKTVIFCLSPFELKKFLKKTKIKESTKKILLKYLSSSFPSFKIKITTVCFKNNVLPFQYSLESLLLVKENEKNKIISLLFDSNIFPPNKKKDWNEKESTTEDIFETSLRFLSKEQQPKKTLQEIDEFLKNILKIKDQPDLVVSNDYNVFPFNEKKDRVFKKIVSKYLKNVKIFWPFSFFKNMEFCLSETNKFCQTNL